MASLKCRLFLILVGMVCIMIWIFMLKEKDVLHANSSDGALRVLTSKQVEEKRYGQLLLYNRVPKTGSTSFMNVVYKLTLDNHFSAAYVNVSSKSHRWLFSDKYFFAKNITYWKARQPGIFHGHFPFVSFIPMGFPQPLYINIVRDPLERLVSHYYFLRYGDTYLPNKIRKKQGDKTTFDECVIKKQSDCNPEKLWIQIPYFCGSDPDCWKPGNKAALHRAKRNVINYYFLVGTTDRIGDFLDVLEKTLPRFFNGASSIFNTDGGLHIRKTKKKVPLEESTIQHFKSNPIWKMEQDFYLFIKDRFNNIYKDMKRPRSVDYIKVLP